MKKLTIIGAGGVGRSIALALFSKGISVDGIYSRRGASAKRLAAAVKVRNYGTLKITTPLSGLVVIAVPDAEISSVVSLLRAERRSLKGITVVHTSGTLTSDVLQPLRALGASVGSFHPLQTFSAARRSTSFTSIYCAVEGDRSAVTVGEALARALGARSFRIRKSDKTKYHIAAVFASNYLVTLLSAAEQTAGNIGLSGNQFRKIIRPLVIQTAENVLNASPAKALTGPIKRGDGETVTEHIRTLEISKELKHLLPLYAALGIETAHLAKRRK